MGALVGAKVSAFAAWHFTILHLRKYSISRDFQNSYIMVLIMAICMYVCHSCCACAHKMARDSLWSQRCVHPPPILLITSLNNG